MYFLTINNAPTYEHKQALLEAMEIVDEVCEMTPVSA